MKKVNVSILSKIRTDDGEDTTEFFTFGTYELGENHCVYGTPYGEFTMGINAYEVESELNDEGGRLRFRYSIDVNSDFISENEMLITIS